MFELLSLKGGAVAWVREGVEFTCKEAVPEEGNVMHEFTAKYADQIQGVLNGFDRLVFRGSLRKDRLQVWHAGIPVG